MKYQPDEILKFTYCIKLRKASCTLVLLGGSTKFSINCLASPVFKFKDLTFKITSSNCSRFMSGSRYSLKFSNFFRENMCQHSPFWILPARPALCIALDLEIHSVVKLEALCKGTYLQ